MKPFLGKFIDNILAYLEESVLAIVCLYEMGLSPLEKDAFICLKSVVDESAQNQIRPDS